MAKSGAITNEIRFMLFLSLLERFVMYQFLNWHFSCKDHIDICLFGQQHIDQFSFFFGQPDQGLLSRYDCIDIVKRSVFLCFQYFIDNNKRIIKTQMIQSSIKDR